MIKVGIGYDAHRLVEGRTLILGGVEIDSPRGLLGHSDGDVLCHAIADALLGAAGLGDLGEHFPDTDPALEGASSINLLAQVREMLSSDGYVIVHIDATIVAEGPKLWPHKGSMREQVAVAAHVKPHAVSIKATTTEGMGFEGRGEGMSAMAVAVIERRVDAGGAG